MTPSFVIFIESGRWRVGAMGGQTAFSDVTLAADAAPADIARQIMQALEANGYSGSGITLAIPSEWCLCAAIDTSGLPKKEAHQAMLYRLEEQFPIAAEDIVADFVTGEAQAFGVAVQVAAMRGLLDALEACGVRVQSICPASLLSLQHEVGNGAADCDAMLRRRGDGLELFVMDHGRPRGWQMLPQAPADLALALRVAALGRLTPLRLASEPLTPELRQELAQMPEIEIRESAHAETDLSAMQAVEHTNRGGPAPWIDLRRDALAPADPNRAIRRPLSFAVVASVLLCLCLSLAMVWRGYHYGELADENEKVQLATFRRLFPERQTPGELSISKFMADEEGRLAAGSGQSSQAPVRASALASLRELLIRLPTDVRYRITLLRLSDEGVYLEGEARSLGDTDSFVAALRAEDGFAVESPPTTPTSQGVSFTVNGAAPAAATPVALPVPATGPTTREATP